MIVAAVQVRMVSTRLPGKALAEIMGRPMLWHIVNRLRFAGLVDQVVIATSNEPIDALIRTFAQMHDILYFAGSELDLIDRLYRTARHFGAQALVRITGDCPLVDPGLIDEVVAVYLAHSADVDYVSNVFPPTYPDGLDIEVYPIITLERLWKEIKDPFWREWFSSYLMKHREAFRIMNVAYPEDLSALRWTVDYKEDLAFVRQVYRRLYREGEARIFGMKEVLALIDAEPELATINARYARNEGYAMAMAAYRNRRIQQEQQEQGKEKI